MEDENKPERKFFGLPLVMAVAGGLAGYMVGQNHDSSQKPPEPIFGRKRVIPAVAPVVKIPLLLESGKNFGTAKDALVIGNVTKITGGYEITPLAGNTHVCVILPHVSAADQTKPIKFNVDIQGTHKDYFVATLEPAKFQRITEVLIEDANQSGPSRECSVLLSPTPVGRISIVRNTAAIGVLLAGEFVPYDKKPYAYNPAPDNAVATDAPVYVDMVSFSSTAVGLGKAMLADGFALYDFDQAIARSVQTPTGACALIIEPDSGKLTVADGALKYSVTVEN